MKGRCYSSTVRTILLRKIFSFSVRQLTLSKECARCVITHFDQNLKVILSILEHCWHWNELVLQVRTEYGTSGGGKESWLLNDV